MSFERFMSSDVYVFEHVGGWIECCMCHLVADHQDENSFKAPTPREIITHLNKHETAGDDTGGAIPRIIKAYDNLDIVIEPYKRKE